MKLLDWPLKAEGDFCYFRCSTDLVLTLFVCSNINSAFVKSQPIFVDDFLRKGNVGRHGVVVGHP